MYDLERARERFAGLAAFFSTTPRSSSNKRDCGESRIPLNEFFVCWKRPRLVLELLVALEAFAKSEKQRPTRVSDMCEFTVGFDQWSLET